MAAISLNLDGEVTVSDHAYKEGDCISVSLHSFFESCGTQYTYSKDTLYLHGSSDEIRRFAEMILSKLPAKAEAPESAPLVSVPEAALIGDGEPF